MGSIDEMKLAFVIGNGHSRTVFDISKLRDKGILYGCNLLITDMQVDNTIACDRMMLIHLLAQGYDKTTNLWTRPRWRNTISDGVFFDLPVPIDQPQERWDREIHWGSGLHAINLAAKQGADIVIMIGFDLWPRNDGKNNIYIGKSHLYDDKSVDPSHYIYQMSKLLSIYKDTSFVQIQPDSWKDPAEWITKDNYSRDTFSGLTEMLRQI